MQGGLILPTAAISPMRGSVRIQMRHCIWPRASNNQPRNTVANFPYNGSRQHHPFNGCALEARQADFTRKLCVPQAPWRCDRRPKGESAEAKRTNEGLQEGRLVKGAEQN